MKEHLEDGEDHDDGQEHGLAVFREHAQQPEHDGGHGEDGRKDGADEQGGFFGLLLL